MNNKSVVIQGRSEAVYMWPMIVIPIFCYFFVEIDFYNNFHESKNVAASIYLLFFALTLFTALVKIEDILTLVLLSIALVIVVIAQVYLPEGFEFRKVFPRIDIETLVISQNIYLITSLFFLFISLVSLGKDEIERVKISGSRVHI